MVRYKLFFSCIVVTNTVCCDIKLVLLQMDQKSIMRLAINEAMLAVKSGDGGPFGAVIVQEGTIIASGHNEYFKKCDPTAHAEMMAIRNACERMQSLDLAGCDLYTSCYPCPMCFTACLWAKVHKIYYGASAAEAPAADQQAYATVRSKECTDKRMESVFMEERLMPFKLWEDKQEKPCDYSKLSL